MKTTDDEKAEIERSGMAYSTYTDRRRRGMSHQEAIETPVMGSETARIRALCEKHDVRLATFRERIRRGLSESEALRPSVRRRPTGIKVRAPLELPKMIAHWQPWSAIEVAADG